MEPKAYDVPQVAEGMTPDAAKLVLDRMHADAAVDVLHPYTNAHHPQHSAFAKATAALHEVWAKRPDAAETPTSRACAEALAAVDAKRDMLASDVDEEVEKLRALGFTGEVPADPQPHHLTALRMQRLHAEGDYERLLPIMEGELRSLRASGETLTLFRSFMAVEDVDSDLRDEIAEKLIGWIHRANVKRYAKPKPSTEDEA